MQRNLFVEFRSSRRDTSACPGVSRNYAELARSGHDSRSGWGTALMERLDGQWMFSESILAWQEGRSARLLPLHANDDRNMKTKRIVRFWVTRDRDSGIAPSEGRASVVHFGVRRRAG
ncbi:hypothetical protein GCM10009565_71080 [Amycolatopsis albidoflavus]